MSRVNPTEFAILGLLAEAPRSGYDIKKEVEESLSHFWYESFGHIYPMLHRLRDRGLVAHSVERRDGRPDRKVYSITEDGRKALEDWFAEPSAVQRPRNEVLLRIFFGRHARVEHLIRDIRTQRTAFESALEQLRAVKAHMDASDEPDPDRIYWELTLAYGLKALAAVAEWGEEAEAALKALSAESAD